MRSTTVGLAIFVLAACWTVPALGLQVDAQAARAESLNRAFKLISDGEFHQAKAELERAAALGEDPCGECLLGMSHVYASEKKWSEAVDVLERAVPLLKTPGALARAYNQLGIANVMLNTPDSLARAEEALRKAVDAGGEWGAMARYNLAEVLFRRQSWAEAAETARVYLQEAGPDDAALKEVRILRCLARSRLPDEPSPKMGEGADLLRVGGEVTRPEILFQIKPVYTEKARRAGTEGTVIVEAIIDDEGCVRHVRSLKEQPDGLTEAAMNAVRSWVFSPARYEGRPVKVYYVLTVNFSVQRQGPPLLRRPEFLSPPPG